MSKKTLLWTGFLFALAGSAFADTYLGIKRNGNTLAIDSVYPWWTHIDSLAFKPEDADSIIWVRYRGKTMIDSVANNFATYKFSGTGEFVLPYRASDASGNVGVYRIKAFVWKNGNRSTTTRSFTWYWYYDVVTDPPGDVDTSDVSLAATLTAAERDSLFRVTHNPFSLVPNGSFEQGTRHWALTGTTTPKVLAYNAANMFDDRVADGAYAFIAQGGTTVGAGVSDSFNVMAGDAITYGGHLSISDNSGLAGTRYAVIGLYNASNSLIDSISTNGVAQRIPRSRTLRVASNGNTGTAFAAGTYRIRLTMLGANTTSANDTVFFDGIFAYSAKRSIMAQDTSAQVTGRVTANTDQWNGVPVTGMPMPTYTQPTGFLAATFPAQVASRDSLTLRPVKTDFPSMTIGTATNLTTNNDKTGYTLTAADKDLLADVVMVRKRGTVGAGSTTGKIISTNFVGLNDDDIANNIIVFLPGATTNRYRTAYVTRFFNAGDSAVIRPLLSTTPVAGDSFAVIGIMGKTVSSDSTQAMNATATIDSSLLWRIHQAAWGRGAGQAGFDNVYANGDSLTTAQRVVTAALQSLGVGPYTATVYFLDSASGAAVQGYNASYRDSATQTQFTQAMASDANGKVQANVIGSTTYFVRGAKTTYRFAANADTTLNVASANFTDTVLVVGTGPTAPSVASVVRIYDYVRGNEGRGIPGLKVTATLVKKPGMKVVQYPNTDSSNTLIGYLFHASARTDTSGCYQIDVPRLQTLSDTTLSYTIRIEGKDREGGKIDITLPCTRPPDVATWKWKETNCVE